MKKQQYYIDGKEVSVLEKIQHKLKQLNEALELVEEISDRCAWADDFANYGSIREALDPVFSAAEHAVSEIEDQINEIESQIEEMKEKKLNAEAEVEQEFEYNIQYALA
jgi:septation ring formation regulator EzrA